MKYNVEYICGHKGVLQLFGPMSERERRLERAQDELCPECYRKKKEAGRAEANKEAEEQSRAEGLPELTGSEKQVAWANTLRLKKMRDIDEWINEINEKGKLGAVIYTDDGRRYKAMKEEMLEAETFLLENMTEAKYWIDNRMSTLSDIMNTGIMRIREKKKEEVPEEVERERTEEKAALTVAPETERTKGGVAEIRCRKGSVETIYEKDDDFRAIVKGYGYKWNGSIWEKKITEFTGAEKERVAELGNALLTAGFTVRFPDQESMEKAISGDFEKECSRWIKFDTDKNKLSIGWKERSDTIYNAAQKIPGARYSNGRVLVPVERYREAEDFAETLGFKISAKAKEEINKFKISEENFIRADAVKPQEDISDEERLRAQLAKAGVIEDLKDDIE